MSILHHFSGYAMTRDEILSKSREENNGKDIADLDVQKTAATAAYFSSLGLCSLVSILSWIFTGRISVQCWMIFFGMLFVAFTVKFIKRKKLHELFVAVFYLLVFIALTVVFILELTGKLNAR